MFRLYSSLAAGGEEPFESFVPESHDCHGISVTHIVTVRTPALVQAERKEKRSVHEWREQRLAFAVRLAAGRSLFRGGSLFNSPGR